MRAPFIGAPAAYVAGWPAVVLAEFLAAEPGGIEGWMDARGMPEASRAPVRATYDAIRAAAAAWTDGRTGSARGTETGRPPARGGPLPAMDTTAAAAELGITTRAVRKRIHAGSLPARKQHGRWLVALPDDLVGR